MTPKEKAEELFDKYDDYPLTYHWKKECAIIAVDEILNLMIKEFKWDIFYNVYIEYWLEVKQEIEQL